MSETVRVALATRDLATRVGLRLALRSPGLEVAAEVGDLDQLLSVATSYEIDVVLIGADLPGGALAAIRSIAREAPRARTILLSAKASNDEFVEAVTAGAVGYLRQETQADRLAAIVRAAAAGEAVIPRGFATALLDEIHGRDQLRSAVARRARSPMTKREWEVLRLLAQDLSTAELANRIGITEVTVRRHISTAVAKLGVPDREAAVRLLRSES